MAEALENITLADVVAMFDTYIAKSGSKRRKLGSHIVGKGHAESDDALYDAQIAAGVTSLGDTQAAMDAFKMKCEISSVPSKATDGDA